MSDWRDQEVRNETRSRDRNEWIEDIRGEVADGTGTDVYVCECGDAACAERIRLTRPEYEAVRGYSTRFAISVNHENPEIDQMVSEGGRFSVVQKIAGRAGTHRETDRPPSHGQRATLTEGRPDRNQLAEPFQHQPEPRQGCRTPSRIR
jgi:hypothetical protein